MRAPPSVSVDTRSAAANEAACLRESSASVLRRAGERPKPMQEEPEAAAPVAVDWSSDGVVDPMLHYTNVLHGSDSPARSPEAMRADARGSADSALLEC